MCRFKNEFVEINEEIDKLIDKINDEYYEEFQRIQSDYHITIDLRIFYYDWEYDDNNW